MEYSFAPISVIIPTFNDAHYLQHCLESIKIQSKLPLEIIVVDDGSDNDNAYKIINSNFFSALNIKFLKIKNSGPSIARNEGYKTSKGEFILFLDADDLLHPDALCEFNRALSQLDSKFFGICGQMENFGRFINPSNLYIPETQIDISKLGRKNGLQGQISCFILRSEYFQLVGRFNEELTHYEDFELLLKLFSSWKLRTINKIVLRKRYHKQSLSNKNYEKSFLGGKKFLKLVSDKSLLPMPEIMLREKENFLTYGKQLLLHRNFDRAFQVFKDCFDSFPPDGPKEYFVSYLAILHYKIKALFTSH
jgi:glycosyltransferase involved in cell wall biosynthesis